MSILDSPDEATAAQSRLKLATDASLAEDLSYWTVAAYDAAEDYRVLAERQASVRRLHAEAEHWVGLIAHEMRSRRQGDRTRALHEEPPR